MGVIFIQDGMDRATLEIVVAGNDGAEAAEDIVVSLGGVNLSGEWRLDHPLQEHHQLCCNFKLACKFIHQ